MLNKRNILYKFAKFYNIVFYYIIEKREIKNILNLK